MSELFYHKLKLIHRRLQKLRSLVDDRRQCISAFLSHLTKYVKTLFCVTFHVISSGQK